MFYQTTLPLLAAAVSLAAGGPAHWDRADLGKVPRGWKALSTGADAATRWELRADKTAPSGSGLALVQTGQSPNRVFNLCAADEPRRADVELSVSFKAISGKNDQGGGLAWRLRDGDNYYVARMNPLEDNFRLYKVVRGKRVQLATREGLKVKAGTWHTLAVRMKGDRIACSLDGKEYLRATDSALTEPGRVGLWTKSDAVTAFDGFQLRPARPR